MGGFVHQLTTVLVVLWVCIYCFWVFFCYVFLVVVGFCQTLWVYGETFDEFLSLFTSVWSISFMIYNCWQCGVYLLQFRLQRFIKWSLSNLILFYYFIDSPDTDVRVNTHSIYYGRLEHFSRVLRSLSIVCYIKIGCSIFKHMLFDLIIIIFS